MRISMRDIACGVAGLIAGMMLVVSSLVAQEPGPGTADTTLFRVGLAEFSADRHATALALFNRLIREYPASDRITAAMIMRGKALVALSENLEGARAMKSFLATY